VTDREAWERKEETLFFFLKKKKQKDFFPFSGGGRRPGIPNDGWKTEKTALGVPGRGLVRKTERSFLVLFFKREHSSSLIARGIVEGS